MRLGYFIFRIVVAWLLQMFRYKIRIGKPSPSWWSFLDVLGTVQDVRCRADHKEWAGWGFQFWCSYTDRIDRSWKNRSLPPGTYKPEGFLMRVRIPIGNPNNMSSIRNYETGFIGRNLREGRAA